MTALPPPPADDQAAPELWWTPSDPERISTFADIEVVFLDENFALPADAVRLAPAPAVAVPAETRDEELEQTAWERDVALARVAAAEAVQSRMALSLPDQGPWQAWSERDRAVRDYEGELSEALSTEEPARSAPIDWAQIATRVARERGALRAQVAAVRALIDDLPISEYAADQIRAALGGTTDREAVLADWRETYSKMPQPDGTPAQLGPTMLGSKSSLPGSETPAETGGTPETDGAPDLLVCTCTPSMRNRRERCEGCVEDDHQRMFRDEDRRWADLVAEKAAGSVSTTPDPERARLSEVLDALGMAGTRDWDDVLNALRCLRKTPNSDAANVATDDFIDALYDELPAVVTFPRDALEKAVRAALAGTAPTPREPGYQRIADAIEDACQAADLRVWVDHDGQRLAEGPGLRWLATVLDKAGLIDWQAFETDAPALDPVLIGTHADPDFVAHQDHKHPVEGCGYCPSEETSDG